MSGHHLFQVNLHPPVSCAGWRWTAGGPTPRANALRQSRGAKQPEGSSLGEAQTVKLPAKGREPVPVN